MGMIGENQVLRPSLVPDKIQATPSCFIPFKTAENAPARGGAGTIGHMEPRLAPSRPAARRRILRVGAVSFFNTKPLIWGLDPRDDCRLLLDVPSQLLSGLRERRFDIALLPAIDFQRLPRLGIVPASGIGCDGPTLTVRIFSRVPINRIDRLACDTDSHTSVALARIILAETFGTRPQFVDLDHAGDAGDSRLLIGDKVVCEEPPGFPHQLDLGAAWKDLTGLPFVFAVWMARQDADLGDLPARLENAKRDGLQNVDTIIRQYAIPRGWPAGIARQYLTQYLKFDIGERQLEAMRRFYELAAKYRIIETPPRELDVLT